nr:immunoglobulin light chain junction region [Macaca mulatta]MPN88568.1 immunoglobulin light chain junction region [Macaca mulatta]MPN89005.1 immunoglobulin light chain junction region [Macaca mulatta]MPN89972.1 immunoglobulin light chain junction region [Macaca mulatta]MPN90039.1 immunoglobulin light chain junction region [Macaca mulatta]
CQQYDNCPF